MDAKIKILEVQIGALRVLRGSDDYEVAQLALDEERALRARLEVLECEMPLQAVASREHDNE